MLLVNLCKRRPNSGKKLLLLMTPPLKLRLLMKIPPLPPLSRPRKKPPKIRRLLKLT